MPCAPKAISNRCRPMALLLQPKGALTGHSACCELAVAPGAPCGQSAGKDMVETAGQNPQVTRLNEGAILHGRHPL
jgi:hypothetical protein